MEEKCNGKRPTRLYSQMMALENRVYMKVAHQIWLDTFDRHNGIRIISDAPMIFGTSGGEINLVMNEK